MKTIKCATLENVDAKFVDVEVSFVRALPSFSIVGLAQTSIQESRERIKSALSAIEFKFPPQKLVINLSPSDIKKSGTQFDFPMALGIALYKEDILLEEFVIFGELGLDGTLKDTNNIFPIVLSLAQKQLLEDKIIIIPTDSFSKISKIPNLKIIHFSNLKDAIESLKSKEYEVIKSGYEIEYNFLQIEGKKYYFIESFEEDFWEIKGQERAKRASLIASAGFHNILFEGSPGCGKSMCAKRMKYILPPMSLEEILQKAKIDALNAKEPDFKPQRSFRSPHASSSKASILGGANRSMGEVALAHNGIFFADEATYFPKNILESLREPLQDYQILISRAHDKIRYDTKFIFVAAINPCPCGNLFSKTKECHCSELEIKRYKSKLSAPILDRIELYVQMEEIEIDDQPTITSKEMFELVKRAFIMQKKRKQSEFNGKLSDREISKYCILDKENQNILNNAIIRFELSQRAINNILKVARTIADLDESEQIEKKHLLEALSYRMKK